MFGLGIWEIVLLLAVVLLLFGPSRLPGLGKSLGESIRGFKKGLSDNEIDVTEKRKIEDDKNNKS
ncbi:MAG: twin-arginine translocase TatA/TatE family subunit [Bdellovibrionales bacterium]|nr:twin-arginine translocase TatA/TatE family subunit [Bdellovibrionales bacterium]